MLSTPSQALRSEYVRLLDLARLRYRNIQRPANQLLLEGYQRLFIATLGMTGHESYSLEYLAHAIALADELKRLNAFDDLVISDNYLQMLGLHQKLVGARIDSDVSNCPHYWRAVDEKHSECVMCGLIEGP
jgi:hypothetical protein